jgi:hypothetical protein
LGFFVWKNTTWQPWRDNGGKKPLVIASDFSHCEFGVARFFSVQHAIPGKMYQMTTK